MNELTQQQNIDNFAGKLISAYMVLYALNMLFQTSINVPVISQNSTYIFGGLFLAYFVIGFYKFRNVMNSFIIGEIIVWLLFGLSILRYSGYTSEIFARCMWTIVFCIPLIATISHVDNIKEFLHKTRGICLLVIAIMIYISINSTRIGGSGEYNMAIGYTLLFPTVYSITLIREKKLFIIPAILSFIFIVLYGSRGPIACIGIFLIFFILFGVQSNSLKGLVLKVTTVLIIIAFIIFDEQIMKSIAVFVSGHNISSRNLSYYLNNRLFADSGRSSILETAYSQINAKPILGWGIAGDIICMNQYPHRLDVELMIDFGYIIGIILCIIIIYAVISGFINSKEYRAEYLCLMSSGFVPLFFSHTYLSEPFFWIFMGLCFSVVKKHSSIIKGKIVIRHSKTKFL